MSGKDFHVKKLFASSSYKSRVAHSNNSRLWFSSNWAYVNSLLIFLSSHLCMNEQFSRILPMTCFGEDVLSWSLDFFKKNFASSFVEKFKNSIGNHVNKATSPKPIDIVRGPSNIKWFSHTSWSSSRWWRRMDEGFLSFPIGSVPTSWPWTLSIFHLSPTASPTIFTFRFPVSSILSFFSLHLARH